MKYERLPEDDPEKELLACIKVKGKKFPLTPYKIKNERAEPEESDIQKLLKTQMHSII